MAMMVAAVAGCGDSVGPDGFGEQVSLSFRVAVAGGAAAPAAPRLAATGPTAVGGPLVVSGTNGALTLDSLFIIINEVELHRADPSCDSVEVAGSDCGDFEAGPRFLDLPLDGERIEAVTALIPQGTYKELDFEIEDLEDDEGDPTEAALIAAVRSQILDRFPEWPEKASGLVVGSFTPVGGSPAQFRVFLEAEVEIEFELIPNLVVDDAGAASRDLTVDVAPDIWFKNADGTVRDLSLDDGELLEFEVEMEDGFTEIEFDD